MKKLLTTITITLSITIHAQCDSSFFLFEKGKTLEYTTQNPEGEVQFKTLHEITNVSETLATVIKRSTDQKETQAEDNKYVISCENGNTQIDHNQYIPQSALSRFKDKKMEIKGNFIIIPNDITAGQALPDGKIDIEVTINSNVKRFVKIEIVERMVEAKETIETPAGTYEAFRISERTNISTDMGSLWEYTSMYRKSWITREIGFVKIESYPSPSRKIKPVNITLLSAIR